MRFENNYYSVTKEANQISRIGLIGCGDIPPQPFETRQRYLFRSEIRSEGKYRCSQGSVQQCSVKVKMKMKVYYELHSINSSCELIIHM